MSCRRCTNCEPLVACTTKLCTLTPDIFSIIIVVFPLHKTCLSVHMHRAESSRRRFAGLHYGTSCHLFWHQEFEGDAKIFGMDCLGLNLGGDNRYYLVKNVQTDCWVHAAFNSVGTWVLPHL
jgi:hypothetical protein